MSTYERILELHAKGYPNKDIAKLVERTERFVRKCITGEYKPKARQAVQMPYDAPPEEIAAKCAVFREQSPRHPVGYPPSPVEMKVVPCSEAGIDPVESSGSANDRERW